MAALSVLSIYVLIASPGWYKLIGIAGLPLFLISGIWYFYQRQELALDHRSLQLKRHPWLKRQILWFPNIEKLRLVPPHEVPTHPLYKQKSSYLPEALTHAVLPQLPALHIIHRRGELLLNIPSKPDENLWDFIEKFSYGR